MIQMHLVSLALNKKALKSYICKNCIHTFINGVLSVLDGGIIYVIYVEKLRIWSTNLVLKYLVWIILAFITKVENQHHFPQNYDLDDFLCVFVFNRCTLGIFYYTI